MKNFTLSFLTLLVTSALMVNGIPYYMNRMLHNSKQQIVSNGNTGLKMLKRDYMRINPFDFGNKVERSSWAAVNEAPKSSVTVPKGSRLELECKVRGSPPLQIFWVKGENPYGQVKELLRNSPAETAWEGIAVVESKLVIDCVTPADQGLIYCAAVADDTIELSMPTMLMVEGRNDTRMTNCGKPSKPTITFHMLGTLSLQGSTVVLPCQATGNPRPRISWFDNYENPIELVSDTRYDIMPNGDLVINNLVWEDMGSYICVAESSEGEDRVRSFVYPVKRGDDVDENHVDGVKDN